LDRAASALRRPLKRAERRGQRRSLSPAAALGVNAEAKPACGGGSPPRRAIHAGRNLDTPFDGLPFSNIQRVDFNPADKEHIIVTTFGGSVFKGPAEPGK
jgi:hypothetical protein